MDNRVRIAIVPAAEAAARVRLLGALAEAFPVEFVAGDDPDAAAVVAFGDAAAADDRPSLCFADTRGATGDARPVWLASSEHLPAAIRGRRLTDSADAAPLGLDPGWIPLASSDAGVLWACDGADGRRRRAAAAPSELEPGERLRDRFRDGSFMPLLPLVELMRSVGALPAVSPRAAFMLDDPNLHAMRYGYASYPALAAHAQQHRYHIAMAMIPLDGWLARGRAVRLFNTHPRWLSLLMHGNNHVHRELAQPRSDEASTALLAQAVSRIAAFERRSGARVDRVMAPPHGAYSLASAQAMLKVGLDALCANQSPIDANGDGRIALRGFRRSDFIGGGLPVLPRYHLADPRADVVFRALLGQPIILYGHHQDLAGGLDVLAEAAAAVNALGDVRWSSLGELAEANYDTRRVDGELHVRMFSRRVRVPVPPGVDRIVLDLPGHEAPERELVRCGLRNGPHEARADTGSVSFPVRNETMVTLTLSHRDSVDPASVRAPKRRAWPLVRRLLTESRDRLTPVLSR